MQVRTELVLLVLSTVLKLVGLPVVKSYVKQVYLFEVAGLAVKTVVLLTELARILDEPTELVKTTRGNALEHFLQKFTEYTKDSEIEEETVDDEEVVDNEVLEF